jgi:acyl carrier protein
MGGTLPSEAQSLGEICSEVRAPSRIGRLTRIFQRACGDLTSDTKPIGDLIDFDSLSAIEATVALETALGTQFDSDNVFVAEVKGRRRALTIAEAAERIAKVLGVTAA